MWEQLQRLARLLIWLLGYVCPDALVESTLNETLATLGSEGQCFTGLCVLLADTLARVAILHEHRRKYLVVLGWLRLFPVI